MENIWRCDGRVGFVDARDLTQAWPVDYHLDREWKTCGHVADSIKAAILDEQVARDRRSVVREETRQRFLEEVKATAACEHKCDIRALLACHLRSVCPSWRGLAGRNFKIQRPSSSLNKKPLLQPARPAPSQADERTPIHLENAAEWHHLMLAEREGEGFELPSLPEFTTKVAPRRTIALEPMTGV